jgi:ABC-2 type transport system permease protein
MSTPSRRALDLLATDWIKFRSVRSTYWSLLVAVVTPVAVSAVVAVAFTSARNQGPPPTRCCPRSSAWSMR